MICLLCLVMTSCSEEGPAPALRVGTLIQDFRLESLSHDRFYLNQHRGDVVVLVFWATYCTNCKAELVELKSLVQKPVVIAAICTDPENVHELKETVKNLGISYPVLLDKGAGLFRKYQMKALPATILIDKEGRLQLIRFGHSPAIMKHIRVTLERLLS